MPFSQTNSYLHLYKKRCCIKILVPIKIRIMPPASSAFDLYFAPNTFPILIPITDNVKVITPIKDTGYAISKLYTGC